VFLNRRIVAEIAHEALLASSPGLGRRANFLEIIRDQMDEMDRATPGH
jgi:hypothetical protein